MAQDTTPDVGSIAVDVQLLRQYSVDILPVVIRQSFKGFCISTALDDTDDGELHDPIGALNPNRFAMITLP